MTGMVDISDDDFRRYAFRSKTNPDIILCWSESRKFVDSVCHNHVVTRSTDGLRIFPPQAMTKAVAVAVRGIQEARYG